MWKLVGSVIAPCSFSAAKYAVEHWHYSQRMPSGKLVKYGVWSGDRLIGSVIYGRGANSDLLTPYGLAQTEGCELVRVALDGTQAEPTSQIVAESLRELHRTNPGLRLVVSFADTAHGHRGTLYQAGNWVYAGVMAGGEQIRLHGRLCHARTVFSRYGTKRMEVLRAKVDSKAAWVRIPPKHRYLMPLDKAMRRQIAPLAQPYPRGSGLDSEPSADQAEGPGATPGTRSTKVRK